MIHDRETKCRKDVNLSDEERERRTAMIRAGKHPARQLTKARILLKADAAASGGRWSDSRIAAALDTSVDTVARQAASPQPPRGSAARFRQ